MQAKVEGIRDDIMTHCKLDIMRQAREFERDIEGQDEDKNLVDMENDRESVKPKDGRDNPLYIEVHGNGRFYNEVDAIWEDWHQRNAKKSETRRLPRPYKKIASSNK